ncbi:hypothetical protein V6N12_050744 [Hibiscus sabdariffa]|uniref:Reverse transcriptase/retrotransposon-derived protein RNase H-like domain-containing protein n=1 Tax=Hibiscus sabdariffa TaxID=183260 RepID=A0ABR2GDA6_9ROSI
MLLIRLIKQDVFEEVSIEYELKLCAQADLDEIDDEIGSEEAPKLELKDLPNHLKYVYLGEDETLPVIIAKGLTTEQEEKLVRILKEYKAAVGWTLADIKGFYRRFVKDFSKIALPLTNLLQKEVQFEFGKKCKEAFDKLKDLLTSAPIIRSPQWDLPFEIMCDVEAKATKTGDSKAVVGFIKAVVEFQEPLSTIKELTSAIGQLKP